MRIFYLVWESLGGRHLLDALKKKNCEVVLFPFSKDDGIKQNDEFTMKLADELLKGAFDCVFTFNYFPMVALACKICHTTYVSWVYDNPCIEMYSKTVELDTNKVFVFDSSEYEKFAGMGITTVHYMPLASAPAAYKKVIDSTGDVSRFICDVAFVGATKTESDAEKFRRFENLDKYTKGYIEGAMRAQKSIYGYNFLEKMLTDEVMAGLRKVVPVTMGGDTLADDRWFFANYFLYQKITGMERMELLKALSEKYKVNLYTLEKTPELPKANNLGEVSYYDEAPLAFHNAKINLNITLKSIARGIPLRVFDILGSGGFLLTNFQADMLELFTPDEDFVFYDSYDDLMTKVEYYLGHESERKEIAENGYRMICEANTYEHRIEKMFDL